MDETSESVGYCRPPSSTRFKKGQSGNLRGRPRSRLRDVPYDGLLGRMVTIREDGRDRRVTAAEAFLLHLTKRGLEGDSAAARASLSAIEAARSSSRLDEPTITGIISRYVSPGAVGVAVDALGIAVKINRYSESARYKLKPWIIQVALARLGVRQLSPEEQKIVLEATHSPQRVQWPEWWSVHALS